MDGTSLWGLEVRGVPGVCGVRRTGWTHERRGGAWRRGLRAARCWLPELKALVVIQIGGRSQRELERERVEIGGRRHGVRIRGRRAVLARVEVQLADVVVE